MPSEGYYQIQARCKVGCDQHLPGEWRKSKDLPAGTNIIQADEEFAAYAEKYPASKPYRLIWIRPAFVVPEAATIMKEITE